MRFRQGHACRVERTHGDGRSWSESHQLLSGQGRHAEPQRTHPLDAALDPDEGGAKFVLEPGVAAFGYSPFR